MKDTISFKSLCYIALKVSILLLFVELSLRLLPASEFPYIIFDKTDNILKNDINILKDGLYTDGNLAQIKAKWHINNEGWNSKYDYHTGDNSKPIIAVIGDSFVEAFQVDVGKSLVGNLQNKLKDYYCYGFGMSGAELSQYLQLSRYVRKNFHPQIMVFIIVDGDILGSLVDYEDQVKALLYFINTSSGISELPIKPYIPSSSRRFLRKFSIARYFTQNKNIYKVEKIKINENIHNQSLTSDQVKKYKLICNYAFAKIRIENPDTTIIIVIDAPRNDIYRGKINSRGTASRNIISNNAYKYGFHVIDLTIPMTELYAINHIKFNFESNGHWNEYGHQVIADQIYKYMVQSRLVGLANDQKK